MSKHRSKWPNPALVISVFALFVALGGTGYAASSLTATTSTLTYTTAVLKNGWAYGGHATYQPAFAKDSSGVIHLHGSLAKGSSFTTAFTLPVADRPLKNLYFTIYTNGGSQGGLAIYANGSVLPLGGQVSTFASLDGITFSR